jgi:hypothetical protein
MLSVILSLVFITLPLVRPDHVHPAGVEGRARAIVHNHQIPVSTTGGSQAYAAHGNHRFAIFLTSVFESVSSKTPQAPPHVLCLPGFSSSNYPHLDVLGPGHAVRLNRPAGPPGELPPGRSPPRT